MQRLFVDAEIVPGRAIEATRDQTHYLVNVLRMEDGDRILVFNGRNGEWMAALSLRSKKKLELIVIEETRRQPPSPDLVYLFAPLKVGRLDYMVQKAVEMGAGILQPVLTQHTQMQKLKTERLQANVIEAAEQCGILSIPAVQEPAKLATLIENWPHDRRIFFCDEGSGTENPVPALKAARETRFAVLVGPEGGFSEDERSMLSSHPMVTPIPLGPRILRADTAAVAALAVVQATIGDWH